MDKENTPEPKSTSLEKYRMPWIRLIDPITGELPKNYEEILKQEKLPKIVVTEEEKSSIEECRMPWLHLIDPITGELPSNYKKLLKKEKETPKIAEEKRTGKETNLYKNVTISQPFNIDEQFYKHKEENFRLKTKSDSKFNKRKTITNNQHKKFNAKKSLKTPITEPQAVKALKSDKIISSQRQQGGLESTSQSGKSNNLTKTSRVTYRPENRFRRQLFTKLSSPASTKETPVKTTSIKKTPIKKSPVKKTPVKTILINKTPLKTPLNSSVLTPSDTSSTKEFLRLEQELQTPANAKKRVNLDQLEEYIRQAEELLKVQVNMINEMKEYCKHLKTDSLSKDQTVLKDVTNNQKSKNLRVDLLKKSVTFDVNTKENIERACDRYQALRSSNDVLVTPKFKERNDVRVKLSNTILAQCLLLEDKTPKDKK